MPGFARVDFRAFAKEPTPEEYAEMERDGMKPLRGEALQEALLKSGPAKDAGLDVGKFVPSQFLERYMRMRQANFSGFEYDRLGDMEHHTMILERWYKKADNAAENKWREDNP